MSENIPLEIQTEILKRVPVKSLFQFRSVSKSWKSLIDSSQFIADYNEYQSRPQRLLIGYRDHVYPDSRSEFDLKYVIVVDDDIFPQHKFSTTFPMPNSFENLDRIYSVGSSQGLLCLLGCYRDYDSYREIAFIWNPAIRKSIAIDVPVFYESHITVMYATVIGFGVCPNTNEPMLVLIAGWNNIWVFRLSSKVWRSLGSNLPRKAIGFKEGHLAIDGFIYWVTYDRLIVSFDMTSEEFTEINLPKSFESNSIWSISKIRESLAVIEYGEQDEESAYDVWMMEHGVPKSFTKLFTITRRSGFVLGFRMNGELISEVNKPYDGKEPAVLEAYEPHTEHIKDFEIFAKMESFLVMSYMETLLLLDQVDNQHIEFKVQSL